jgi:hypothetical protein
VPEPTPGSVAIFNMPVLAVGRSRMASWMSCGTVVLLELATILLLPVHARSQEAICGRAVSLALTRTLLVSPETSATRRTR